MGAFTVMPLNEAATLPSSLMAMRRYECVFSHVMLGQNGKDISQVSLEEGVVEEAITPYLWCLDSCIRQLRYSSIIICNDASIAFNHHTDIYSILNIYRRWAIPSALHRNQVISVLLGRSLGCTQMLAASCTWERHCTTRRPRLCSSSTAAATSALTSPTITRTFLRGGYRMCGSLMGCT